MLLLYIGSGAIGLIALLVVLSTVWARRSESFHKCWEEGEVPEYRELRGRYRIRMYPRWLWWWFVDVKIFYEEHTFCGPKAAATFRETEGLNVAWGILAWGKKIAVKCWNTCVLLNYSQSWWPWRIIRDYVKRRKGESGLYDGKFCVNLPRFGQKQLAWFTMEKI